MSFSVNGIAMLATSSVVPTAPGCQNRSAAQTRSGSTRKVRAVL